jgi:hypothetical protein
MADGWSSYGRIGFSADARDDGLIKKINDQMWNVFGLRPSDVRDNGTYVDMPFHSNALERYFEGMSWLKRSSPESFVPKDLKKYRGIPEFFSSNPDFFTVYPEALNELFYMWHVVDDEFKADRIKRMKATLFKRRSRINLIRDFYHLWRLF